MREKRSTFVHFRLSPAEVSLLNSLCQLERRPRGELLRELLRRRADELRLLQQPASAGQEVRDEHTV